MGAAVSSGESNDELVDNLMKYGYIRTRKVEQVFRAVDRADYVLPSHRERAYNDLAWKHGNIHLSAPCIYSEVMESLSLEPGLSFLNLGSGTGYLSTMAGLILNQHGTNHGIELHEDCLNYAYERLEEFKQKSLALDEFDFCEPVFIQGNCLNVTPSRQYDRVYCGAACPENYEGFIKQFVCIGGILIMPFKDHLLRVLRIDEDTWLHFKMLPVSFTTLVVPTASEQTLFYLPECAPLSLQELCRGKIRRCLRSNVWKEHEDLETKIVISLGRRRFSPPQQTLTRFVIPVLGESDESVSDESVSDEDDEFTRRLCVLLNVDVDPRDLYTTSQVRAVMLCNMNEGQNWQVVNSNSNSNVEWNNENPESSMDNNKSISRTKEDNGVQIASNSTEEKQTENKAEVTQNFTNVNETYLNLLKHTETLLNISESDSETEQDETVVQRKKMAKREKTDSGIVEDVNLNNEDSSPRSNTSQSESEPVDPPDTTEAMDVDASSSPRDQNKPQCACLDIHHPQILKNQSIQKQSSKNMNTSPDCAFTFCDQQRFDLGLFLHSSKIVTIPHGTVQGVKLNEGWTEGARGEISCAEEANAQLPGRSRVRTFAITLSTVGRLLTRLVIAPEKADKIDWDMSMPFELTPPTPPSVLRP